MATKPKDRSPITSIIAAAAIVAVTALGALPSTGSAAAAGMTLTIADRVAVETVEVRLGQLADISGGDPDQSAALQALEIGRAPLAGRSRTISRDYILMRLRQAGFDPDALVIRAPDDVTLVRRAVTLSASDIEMMVREFVMANPPFPDADMTIEAIRIPGDVLLPTGDIRHELEYLPQGGASGTLPVNVFFSRNGRRIERIMATVHVVVMKEVPVTRHPIARYQMVQPEDLMMQTLDVTDLPPNAVLSYEDIQGQRARRSLGAQRVLRTDQFEFPPAVKRGDRVLIVAESAGLRITAIGEIKSSKGRIGERVRVVNLDSNKVLHARVVDGRTVQVAF